jgi:hypothetical protein
MLQGQPLPQHAHVLKELESEAVLDLFAEAGRLRRFLLLSAPQNLEVKRWQAQTAART